MDVVSQYANVNGLNMHYVTAGEGAPVVLLHGFPDTHAIWRRQIPALAAAGFRVIAPDLRGYGKTDMPGEAGAYAIDFLADDVLRLMDALGIEQATVVGHDWGALIGWHLAMHAPQRVSRYAALSVGHPKAIAKAGLGQKLRFWYMGVFVTPVLAETLLKAGNWAALRSMNRSREQQQLWIDALAPQGRLTAALNYYRANLKASSTRRWKPVDVPVLGVWSEHDPALGERQMLETREQCRAGFQYARIDGVGHWLQLSGAEKLNTLLIEFATTTAAVTPA
ncbi:alpha/beta fold hydrolase [Massilia sp. HP4]|uniref:alpha/beta fold hydrolase n=1 Tax=Massilia sp. HP4 TaxID=2562316 RepID=UPI0010BFD05A|nr:alpha/beta hydrolase [Massilia sp. HP4]